MDRDFGVLVDILIAARDILEFNQATTKEEFLRSKLLQSAVLHKLVVIGEAAADSLRDSVRSIRMSRGNA